SRNRAASAAERSARLPRRSCWPTICDAAWPDYRRPQPRQAREIHLWSMATAYQDLVSQLRTAFPAPVSDRVHDAYFVFSFLRALDQVDALKSAAPMLGTPVTLDYDAARLRRVPDEPSTLEGVTAELVHYLSG